jgi:hypothetical protein
VALPFNEGLVVEFDQYQYGGTGADGIGFFLADGSAPSFTVGADDGSLGFAQRSGIPAVVLPYTVGGSKQAGDLFGLFDDTLDQLLKAAQ